MTRLRLACAALGLLCAALGGWCAADAWVAADPAGFDVAGGAP